MPVQIPQIRVFLSSPADVKEERQIALEVIEHLPNRPAFREKVAFRVIAWDKPGAGISMRATLTPQEAINQGLPKPSECDIVVVLFWSRMGTPFIHTDGKEYLSGTYWEMLDALHSKRAETIIYRRTDEKRFKSDDKDGIEQSERVKAFFRSELFYKDGHIVRGINNYETPDDFRQQFETHFEDLVLRLLEKQSNNAQPKRLLEAAMPACSTLGADTQLKVKISLLDSIGLKGELPEVLPCGDIIQQADVLSSRFEMRFQKDEGSGVILTSMLCVEVSADDFQVSLPRVQVNKICDTGQFELHVPPTDDSRTLNFQLKPKSVKKIGLSIVYVYIFQNGESIADIAVQTHIVNNLNEMPICGDWRLTASTLYVSREADTYFKLGVDTITPTHDLNADQISKLAASEDQQVTPIESQTPDTGTVAESKINPSSIMPRHLMQVLTALGSIAVVAMIVLFSVILPSVNNQRDTNATSTALTNATNTLISKQTPISTIDLTATATLTVNGVEMVRVPKGCFEMGSDKSKDKDANSDELPAHKVCFDQEFQIDKYEVSEASFKQFYEEGGYVKQENWSFAGWQWRQTNNVNGPKVIPALGDNYPRRGVSWYEAEAYANWRGECLPTEAQWEYVARGPNSLIYPWGNEFIDSYANTSQNHLKNLAYTTAFPRGESWVGAYNLAGNVWEWVRDFYSPYPDLTATPDVQKTLINNRRVLRGGSWSDDPLRARSAFRWSDDPGDRVDTYGFRLASC